MHIEISNLGLNVIESDIKKLFTPYGEIGSIELLRDKWSNRPRGRAFVEMPVDKDARNAMSSLEGAELTGRPIKLREVEYQPGQSMHSAIYKEYPTSFINMGLNSSEKKI